VVSEAVRNSAAKHQSRKLRCAVGRFVFVSVAVPLILFIFFTGLGFPLAVISSREPATSSNPSSPVDHRNCSAGFCSQRGPWGLGVARSLAARVSTILLSALFATPFFPWAIRRRLCAVSPRSKKGKPFFQPSTRKSLTKHPKVKCQNDDAQHCVS